METNNNTIKLNPCKIPKGIVPQIWIDALIETYCLAYGLLERGKHLMGEAFYALYEEAGVFTAQQNNPDWENVIPELSKKVTFAKVYEKIAHLKWKLGDPSISKDSIPYNTISAYERLLERLSAFGRDYSIECNLFGSSDGVGVDELFYDDSTTILEEAKHLENPLKDFLFGIIATGKFHRLFKDQWLLDASLRSNVDFLEAATA